MGELKQKHRQIKEKKVLNRDEVYHGALEDILMGVYKSEHRKGNFRNFISVGRSDMQKRYLHWMNSTCRLELLQIQIQLQLQNLYTRESNDKKS